MPPSDPHVLAEAGRLHTSGREAVNAGRVPEAIALLRRGLAALRWSQGTRSPWDDAASVIGARLLITLAYAEAEHGDTELGLSLLDEATTHVADEDEGVLIQQRALILRMSRRHAEALECFAQAEPLLEQGGQNEILVALYLNRGTVHGGLGRFTLALFDFTSCHRLALANGYPILAAKALHARGIVEKLLGDVPVALKSLEEARKIYDVHAPDMGPVLLAAQCYALHAAGLTHEAYLRLDGVISRLRDLRQYRQLATAEVFRAQLSLELGNLERSVREAEAAGHQAREQGDTILSEWAELIRRLAEYQGGHRSLELAEACLDLARRQRDQSRDGDADLAVLLAARTFLTLGATERAEDTFRIVARARAHEQISVKLTRLIAKSELAVGEGTAARAFRAIRTGLTTLQDFRSRLGSVELQVGSASLGRELGRAGLSLALASKRPWTVFTWSERSRAQAFRLPPIRPVEDRDTADLLAQVRQLRNGIRKAELSGESSREDRLRCASLERLLRERSWLTVGPGESIPEYSAAQIRSELTSRGSALVSFLAHEERMHVLVLVNGKLRHLELGSSSEAEEAARRLVADLDALTGRNLPARMEQSIRASIHHQTDWLADALFSEIMPLIGDRDLVIVPTRMLSSLPWGLLPPLRGRPVTVAPSAAVWMAATTRVFPEGGTPLLAAGPDLALAESELTDIAFHYPQGTVLRGEHATASGTLAALDGAPIAHLAAHGHHEPDNVLFSRLDFADGPLMAYDIARLANPPRHVTLSACDVGRSVVAVGDETLGFTAALLYAGTSTVVSSVARVAHDVAAQVMVDYHGKLAEGIAPARALAEANAKHDLAPFVLFGAG